MSGILPVELKCCEGWDGGEGRTVGLEPKSFFSHINASEAGGRGGPQRRGHNVSRHVGRRVKLEAEPA